MIQVYYAPAGHGPCGTTVGRMRLFSRPERSPATGPRATDDDVYYAYRLILKRDPDKGGLEYYRSVVAGGISLDQLVKAFTNSDEYRDRVAQGTRPVAVDLGGYQVCVQSRDTDFAQAILATRDYEPHVRQAVRDHVGPDDIVVDIGANVGCIAFEAAMLAGEGGLVVAVEPNPQNLQLLLAGVVLNGFGNVRVLPCAASDAYGVLALAGGLSNTHVTGAGEAAMGADHAQAVVLDDLLAWLPRLDFVKLDVEGHEPQALDGMRALLGRHRPTLLVEFNPRTLADLHGHDPAALADRLFALHPRLRAISHFGDDQWFEQTADLMAYWERRNREVVAEGLLPDRLLHFDLIAPRTRTSS